MGKKAAKARKRPAAKKPAAKKKAATRKRRPAARKAAVTRRPSAAATATAMPTTELDNRIAIVRANLRELIEQAASYSGAADEERMSERIAEREATLAALIKQREELS
ncbi:MAG: hypothetical protein ACXU9B_06355 [Reyranella sp.]